MRVRPNYQPWELSAADFPIAGSIAEQIRFLCRFGLLAPSVHNTQPWRFAVRGSRLEIILAAERRLGPGDPTGREAWLSLGACLENIMVAGRHFGLQGIVQSLELAHDMVTVTWRPAAPRPNPDLLAAIINRTSNRRPYQHRAIAPVQLKQIATSYRHSDVKVIVTAQPALMHQVAELTGHGIGLALSNRAFVRELAALLRPSWTRSRDGFAARPDAIGSWVEAQRTRWLPMARHQAAHEQRLIERSGALILVLSRGDTRPHWLEAGRAYQHCALEATRLGLATSTTAAVVEAADYHLDIEAACQTAFRLQTIMRIGYESAHPHAPRRSLDETFAQAT